MCVDQLVVGRLSRIEGQKEDIKLVPLARRKCLPNIQNKSTEFDDRIDVGHLSNESITISPCGKFESCRQFHTLPRMAASSMRAVCSLCVEFSVFLPWLFGPGRSSMACLMFWCAMVRSLQTCSADVMTSDE